MLLKQPLAYFSYFFKNLTLGSLWFSPTVIPFYCLEISIIKWLIPLISRLRKFLNLSPLIILATHSYGHTLDLVFTTNASSLDFHHDFWIMIFHIIFSGFSWFLLFSNTWVLGCSGLGDFLWHRALSLGYHQSHSF